MSDHWLTVPLDDWEELHKQIASLKLQIQHLEFEILTLRDALHIQGQNPVSE